MSILYCLEISLNNNRRHQNNQARKKTLKIENIFVLWHCSNKRVNFNHDHSLFMPLSVTLA